MDITITHKPLNREEIATLTPTVLYDSPRGGYRLLWGTWISRPKRQSGWLRWTRPRSRGPNAISPGGVIWVAIFLYLFFRCFGCFDSDRMTFDPTPSAPQGEVRK